MSGGDREHTWHLWPGEDVHHAGKQVTTYTRGVLGSHVQEDVAAMRAALGSPDTTREERVRLLTELDHKWAFKVMEHEAVLHNTLVDKREEWERTEDALFMASSDDSDGVDPDFEGDWGDNTRAIYGACRKVEANPTSEEAVEEFAAMLDRFADADLTLTECQMVWDAVRMTYRQTEAIHGKRWLSGCTELVDGRAFHNRPTLACFHTIATAAAGFAQLTPRQRGKAARWAEKCMAIFHKRVAILKEFGVSMPSWDQIRVSSPSRDAPVPTVHIHTAIARAGGGAASAMAPASSADAGASVRTSACGGTPATDLAASLGGASTGAAGNGLGGTQGSLLPPDGYGCPDRGFNTTCGTYASGSLASGGDFGGSGASRGGNECGPGGCGRKHSHFPCNGAPAQPHERAPE